MHHWIVAPYRRDREHMLASIQLAENSSYFVDCHRHLRGPYTGTGELFRKLVPNIYHCRPEHVITHGTEILCVSPELKSLVEATYETLTTLAIPGERTRFFSRLRTLRLAHGLVDFLNEYVALAQIERCMLVFENVQAADALDQEFLTVLLRRADPRRLLVIVNSSLEPLSVPLQDAFTTYTSMLRPDPLDTADLQQRLADWHIPGDWGRWLLQHSGGWRGEWDILQPLADAWPAIALPQPDATLEEGLQILLAHYPAADRHALARAYVESVNTSDHLLEKIAYEQIDSALRQQWHDNQAEVLEGTQQWSLHLGSIPYHREHGLDPSEHGAQALQEALDYCINMGYYEATIDFGQRGRKVVDWKTQFDRYWTFTTKMTTSLAALDRSEESEALYNEARALDSNPYLHMQAAYATAMLYTRHHKPERRNHLIAKGWLQEAIALAKLLPDAKESAFQTVFNRNGLALVEMHLGNSEEALRLVSEGIEHLNHALDTGEHRLHRSVLLYNRAQLYTRLGRLDEALADYNASIAQDPHYSEYYFERGNLYRRLGRLQEALEDYNLAVRYSPPYPEVYYNRGILFSLLKRDDEALADYNYVLELDPFSIDALINRSSLLYEREEYAASYKDVERGLSLEPGNAQLLCTFGLLAIEKQQLEQAFYALTSALESDPSLIAAWTNRAIVSYERGDIDVAISDLTHALELDENGTVYYNRALAYQSYKRWQEAIADFSRALTLVDDDRQDIFYQRGRCYLQVGDVARARQDFEQHLALGPSPHLEELQRLDLSLSVNS